MKFVNKPISLQRSLIYMVWGFVLLSVTGLNLTYAQETTAKRTVMAVIEGAAAENKFQDELGDEPVDDFDEYDDLFDEVYGADEGTANGVYAQQELSDPLEIINRPVFMFNDMLYHFLFRPTARVYHQLPTGIRNSAANFLANLSEPVNIFNHLAQTKFRQAGQLTARFGINTTLGLVGLFDPAGDMFGYKRHQEDFGQTLGSYGLGPGFYLVLPLVGPSSLRDGVGYVIDVAIDPAGYLLERRTDRMTLEAIKAIDLTDREGDDYDSLTRNALDAYLSIKSAYIQNRRFRLQQ